MSEWRVIPCYPDYEVSNTGDIRRNGRILSKQIDKRGYPTTGISVEGKAKRVPNHRMVAEAFIEKIDGKYIVDHINRDKTDNRVENLRWATYQENNINHSKELVEIYQLDIDGKIIKKHKSIREALKHLNVEYTDARYSHIRNSADQGRTAFGYNWSFTEIPKNELKRRQRPVEEYDIQTGNVVCEYESPNDACIKNGFPVMALGKVLIGERIHYKERYFRYKNVEQTDEDRAEKLTKKRKKGCALLDGKEGSVIKEFDSIREGAKYIDENNYKNIESKIPVACKNPTRSAGGHYWKYL